MSKQDFLTDESISVLRRLLGVSVHTIYTPRLDVAAAHLAAWKLAFSIKKDFFVNVSCEWSETPRFLNDSWLITVSESSDPIGIRRNESGALIEPCTISMYHAQPIRRIEIFEYYDSSDGEDKESVQYDQAILFRCAEERNFCVACMLNGPGISEYLHFSEDASTIQEMVNRSTIRLVIE